MVVDILKKKSQLIIPYRNDLNATMYVNPNGFMKAKAKSSPVFASYLNTNINVKIPNDIHGNILIPFYGKMKTKINMLPSPKIIHNLTPTKDSFVNSGVSKLNYGDGQEILIGRLKNNIYRSFMRFDIPKFPEELKMYSAVLRLNVKEGNNVPFSIYEVDNNWFEQGITWDNQPNKLKSIYSGYTGSEREYIDINFDEIVLKWESNPELNNGFIIVSENENSESIERFTSKEYSIKPILHIEYKDPNNYSAGIVDIESNIKISNFKSNDLTSLIKIKLYYEIFDLISSINISRPNIFSKIFILINGMNNLNSFLTVKNKGLKDISGYISTNKPQIPSKIKIRKNDVNKIDSNITIRQNNINAIKSSVGVNRQNINGYIKVYQLNNIYSSITIKSNVDNSLNSYISIIKYRDRDLNSSISVWEKSSISSSITVKSGYLASNIFIPFREKSDIRTNIKIQIFYINDIETTLTVGIPHKGIYVFIM